MRKKIIGIVAGGITMLAAALSYGSAGGTAAAGTTKAAVAGPAAWCTYQGGVPATYVPYYGDSVTQGTQLGGKRVFCVFTSSTDGTRITVAANTLSADKPTLAALAYWRKPLADAPLPPGNPASWYCDRIGGTVAFGDRPGDVGGWAPAVQPVDLTSMCMFADGSTIDAWGLRYHTLGFIRGADLTTKFRAQNPPKTAPFRR